MVLHSRLGPDCVLPYQTIRSLIQHKEDEIFQCTQFLAFKTLFSAAAIKLSIVWIYSLC